MDGALRRHLRKAVHNQDVLKLKQLTREVSAVNYILSDRLQDTVLSYSVRHGFLECAEYLLSHPDCRLDILDRNRHSLLDIAISEWLKAAKRHSAELKSGFAGR